jgi:hypothetical protein
MWRSEVHVPFPLQLLTDKVTGNGANIRIWLAID